MRTPGARIRIRRGPFPIDPGMIGRLGTVVTLEGPFGDRYGVQLDGEGGIRLFQEDELEAEETAPDPSGSASLSQSGRGGA
jgi:hypothetical protein